MLSIHPYWTLVSKLKLQVFFSSPEEIKVQISSFYIILVFFYICFIVPCTLHAIRLTFVPLCIDLFALYRFFSAGSRRTSGNSQIAGSEEQNEVQQLPASEPGALMHLVENACADDKDDKETKECKSLFKNLKFFLGREVRA